MDEFAMFCKLFNIVAATSFRHLIRLASDMKKAVRSMNSNGQKHIKKCM